MSEFKVGDEVETKDGLTGEIKKIENFCQSDNCYVEFKDKENGWFMPELLKLLPKYKTLTELWKESGSKLFKGINAKGLIQTFLTVFEDQDGEIAALFWDYNEEVYNSYLGDQADWQLYQEPEDVLIPSKEQCDAQALPQEEVNDLLTEIHEEKPAEKCEHTAWNGLKYEDCAHRNAELSKDKTYYYCIICDSKLEERCLWIVKYENKTKFLYEDYLTESEAQEQFKDRLVRKSSNRELFKVWK